MIKNYTVFQCCQIFQSQYQLEKKASGLSGVFLDFLVCGTTPNVLDLQSLLILDIPAICKFFL
jgi:hypothetical protein